jgi:putative toxin-antitoxin system antitoxin component (TIGR02293 family)
MELISPHEIAAVMKLDAPQGFSTADLEQLVSRGLPKGALDTSLKCFSHDAGVVRALRNTIIAPATYKRRNRFLNAAESTGVVRLARVYAMTKHVWDDEEDARVFLHTRHPLLEGRRPIDVATTELGARRVEELLAKLYFGLPG